MVLWFVSALPFLAEVIWSNPSLEEVIRNTSLAKLALQSVELERVVKADPLLPLLTLVVS